MRGINQRCFGLPGFTDVISLRYDALPGEEGPGNGEIVVNVQLAVEEGERRRRSKSRQGRWGPLQELALYLAHGCDHLSGASDDDPAGRRRMRRRELRWLKEASDRGMLEGLLKDRRGQ
jgi:ssRNA-specific RNase YbeY (16S rRNA maturation enzyme)